MTPTPEEREALIEALASAHRHRDGRGKIASHPAFHDLDEEGRLEAFELAQSLRLLEAAAHAEGLSTTALAVVARIRLAST